jgi:hypothetical protein
MAVNIALEAILVLGLMWLASTVCGPQRSACP